jgi:DNA-binding CsgD family transcriptional regulator
MKFQDRFSERNRAIQELCAQGRSRKSIANQFGLTTARVNQIMYWMERIKLAQNTLRTRKSAD